MLLLNWRATVPDAGAVLHYYKPNVYEQRNVPSTETNNMHFTQAEICKIRCLWRGYAEWKSVLWHRSGKHATFRFQHINTWERDSAQLGPRLGIGKSRRRINETFCPTLLNNSSGSVRELKGAIKLFERSIQMNGRTMKPSACVFAIIFTTYNSLYRTWLITLCVYSFSAR